MDHPVVGVLGASGGLGVSTLSVALGVRASRRLGTIACVDADFGAGGLDVTACVEHLPGLRWSDLTGARGELDGAALLQALPGERSVAVLGCRGRCPSPAVVTAAIASLRAVSALTVVDLGRSLDHASQCAVVVLVAGTSARQLADADAMARQLVQLEGGLAATVLALRGEAHGPVRAEEVAHHLDLPLGAILRPDPRVERDADRGVMPGETRTSVVAAADELLAYLDVAVPTLPGGGVR